VALTSPLEGKKRSFVRIAAARDTTAGQQRDRLRDLVAKIQELMIELKVEIDGRRDGLRTYRDIVTKECIEI
jgi:hypothetical protein